MTTVRIIVHKLCYMATPFIVKFAVVWFALLLHLRDIPDRAHGLKFSHGYFSLFPLGRLQDKSLTQLTTIP